MDIERNEAGLYVTTLHRPGEPDAAAAYEYGRWGAEEALEGWMDLMGLTAKPLGLLAAELFAPGKDGLKTELQPGVLNTALDDLSAAMTDHRRTVALRLVKKLSCRLVLCDGRKVEGLAHYGQDLGLLLLSARANAEVQYGNFIAGLAGRLGVSRAATPSPPSS